MKIKDGDELAGGREGYETIRTTDRKSDLQGRNEAGKGHSAKRTEMSIRNKNFVPEKYGMVLCLTCKGNGYIQKSKRQCCPECGGFGWTIKEWKNP